MYRSAILFVALTLIEGCAAANQNAVRERPGATVNVVHEPIDLSGPITLDQAVQVALERHQLAGREGQAPTAAERLEHERVVRHRTSSAYGRYVRASLDEHVHADAVRLVDAAAAVTRARSGHDAATPVDLNLLLLEQARLHLADRAAAHDLEIARAVLDFELSRAPNAVLGAPTETAPSIVTSTVDDLVARAMHTRQVFGHDVPEHVVRGEVAVAMHHVQQLAESWRVFEAEAMPPATALMQGLEAAYAAGQLPLTTFVNDLRVAFETPLERAARLAEVMSAVAELEWVVGEPLPRTEIPAAALVATAPAAAAPAEAAAPAAASAAPAASTAPTVRGPAAHAGAPRAPALHPHH